MRIHFIFVLVFAISVTPLLLCAQWISAQGISEGSSCYSIVQNGSRLFATTWGNGIKYSDDGGMHWYGYPYPNVNFGMVGNGFFQSVFQYGSDVLACSYGHIYVTKNNGSSWSSPYNFGGWGIYGFAVLKDSAGNDNIFISTVMDIYKMQSSYSQWTKCDTLPFDDNHFASSLLARNGKLFAGTNGYGVFVSKDGGSHWIQFANTVSNASVWALASSDSSIYAGTYDGVFVSTDEGESWNSRNNGLTNTKVYRLLISDNNMFAGTWGGGIFMSSDKGLNWKQVNSGMTDLRISALFATSTHLIAATNDYIWLRPINEMVTGIGDSEIKKVHGFTLSQNYPNPFNPVTTIAFSIAHTGLVTLTIYDELGREIATLANEQLQAGEYTRTWNAEQHSSGLYYYRLTAGNMTITKKLLLIQ